MFPPPLQWSYERKPALYLPSAEWKLLFKLGMGITMVPLKKKKKTFVLPYVEKNKSSALVIMGLVILYNLWCMIQLCG